MSRFEQYDSIDDVDGNPAVNLDAPDRVMSPKDQGLPERAYCKVFGHFWTGHPYRRDGKTFPAATCERCREMRVAEAPLSEVLLE